jgi:hypothetical protein
VATGVEPALEVGTLAEALLFGRRGSVTCRARVMSRQKSGEGELRLAMKIEEIAPASKSHLQVLLETANGSRELRRG